MAVAEIVAVVEAEEEDVVEIIREVRPRNLKVLDTLKLLKGPATSIINMVQMLGVVPTDISVQCETLKAQNQSTTVTYL